MGKVTGSVVLGSGKKAVWEFISHPDHFGEYVHGYEKGRVHTQNQTGLGSTFTWTAGLGPLRLSCTEEVVEWEPEKKVAYHGSMLGVVFDSSMALEPLEKGRCRMGVSVEYTTPRRLGGRAMGGMVISPLLKLYVKRSLDKLQARFGQA